MSQEPMQPAGLTNTGVEGGEPVQQPTPVPLPPITPAPPGVPHLARTSGLAAASLVLGVLGFLSCGLTGFVGLVFGIVALVGISRSAGRLRGQGIAVAGLVLSTVSMVSLVFLAALTMPVIAMAAEEASFDESANRLGDVASLTERYSLSHDGEFPPARDWVRSIGLEDWLLAHPGDRENRRAYAMNIRLDGVRFDELIDAENTVLFFESRRDAALAGGPELFPLEPRYEAYLIVYANGDVGIIDPGVVATLVWEP